MERIISHGFISNEGANNQFRGRFMRARVRLDSICPGSLPMNARRTHRCKWYNVDSGWYGTCNSEQWRQSKQRKSTLFLSTVKKLTIAFHLGDTNQWTPTSLEHLNMYWWWLLVVQGFAWAHFFLMTWPKSYFPLMHLNLTPGRSFTRPTLTSTVLCSCDADLVNSLFKNSVKLWNCRSTWRLCPSPGM